MSTFGYRRSEALRRTEQDRAYAEYGAEYRQRGTLRKRLGVQEACGILSQPLGVAYTRNALQYILHEVSLLDPVADACRKGIREAG